MGLRLRSLLILSLGRHVFADQLVDPVSKDNSEQCDCYLTSGPDPGFFQYHRFWDFRNIPNDGDNDYTTAPGLVSASQSNGTEPFTSSYLNSTEWRTDWAILGSVESTSSPESPITSVNSAQNVYISRNSSGGAESSTYLTLRASRLPDFMSIAEIDSNQNNILHSSIRARFRLIPNGLGNSSAPSAADTNVDDDDSGSNVDHPVDDGAVVGFFTYHNDEQESDIEILTTEPTTYIHYSNQPDYDANTDSSVPDASSNVTLPAGLTSTQWIDHRIDWFEGISRWYANGISLVNKTKNVPSVPSGLILNLWGNGGSWSGNMTPGGQVSFGIEWIEMVFNVSGDIGGAVGSGSSRKRDSAYADLNRRKQAMCQLGCKVDGVKTVGFPELAFNASNSASTSVASAFVKPIGAVSLAALILPLVAGLMFLL